jgi:hypothetical protein
MAFSFLAVVGRGISQDEGALAAESNWQGTVDLGPAALRLQFRFSRTSDGSYSGQLVSIDQGNAVLDLDSVEIKDRAVKLACHKIRFTYQGTFDEKFTKLSGTMFQGAKYPLDLSPVVEPRNLRHVQTWQGTMKAGPREFDFQLRLYRDDAGKWSGKLDSFSENAGDFALEIATYDEHSLSFSLPVTKAKFDGRVDAERGAITGQWHQSGQSFELTFSEFDLLKTRSIEPPKRPQLPSAPYPYRSIDVLIENKADQVTLAGTLTLPQAEGTYAAAILISGSGGQDRDESLLGHKPFLVLSDHLTRAGFAVLRFDDRGVGKSTGDPLAADSRYFARDVSAAMDFLSRHAEIDPKKIGLIGHSEGGLIAPLVATSRRDVAFIVTLAGPGVTGREIVLNQSAAIEKADGVPEAVSAVNRELLLEALSALDQKLGEAEIRVKLAARFEEIRARLPEADRGELTTTTLERGIAPLLTPWFRFFLDYDPRPTLATVRCPVLVLNGELDLQVDPKLNVPEIERALRQGGNSDVETMVLAGLNHLFQTAKTGSPTEYRTIEETFAPVALEAISQWLARRLQQ